MKDVKVIADRNGNGEYLVNIMNFPGLAQDIKSIGSDIKKGGVLVPAQRRLGPIELGLISLVNMAQVEVFAIPRIAVFSTEVADRIEEFSPTKMMLLSACRAIGFQAVDLGNFNEHAGTQELLRLAESNNFDVIITQGTCCKSLIEYGDVKFQQLNLKHCKSTRFSTIHFGKCRTTYLFALPGDIVSAIITFHLLVYPAILKLAGHERVHLQRIQVCLAVDVQLSPEPDYRPASLEWDSVDGIPLAMPTDCTLSTDVPVNGRLSAARSWDALLELPTSEERLRLPHGSFVGAIIIPKL